MVITLNIKMNLSLKNEILSIPVENIFSLIRAVRYIQKSDDMAVDIATPINPKN